MVALNTHLTTTEGLAPEVQTYYDRKMLKDMKPKLVHYQYGQKRPIPRGGGKTINFRKWTPFAAITTPLAEGVVPDGQNLSMTEITATVAQYGGYVAISDLLDLTAIDPVASDAVELMADQGGLSVDTVIRDELHQGTGVQYAGGGEYRFEVDKTDILSTTELRRAVRTLKNNNAKPFLRNGKEYFIAIVSPDTTYDLQSDPLWQDVSKYQDKEAIYTGEIGRIFGVILVETPQAKSFSAANLTAASRTLTVAAWNNTTQTLTVDEAITQAEAAALAGRDLLISDEGETGKPQYLATILSADAGAAGTASLVLAQDQAELGITPAVGDVLYPGEAGRSGAALASTLVFGRNAYGVVDIENGGNVKTIIKPAGSAGSSDPLDQISTVGWKVEGFAARILQQTWMIRIESGFSD
ncbi:MAG: N4-gp56 family major capsid protein [Christensenellales bacterium]|jgi:N4-gp56 family major capsid protein